VPPVWVAEQDAAAAGVPDAQPGPLALAAVAQPALALAALRVWQPAPALAVYQPDASLALAVAAELVSATLRPVWGWSAAEVAQRSCWTPEQPAWFEEPAVNRQTWANRPQILVHLAWLPPAPWFPAQVWRSDWSRSASGQWRRARPEVRPLPPEQAGHWFSAGLQASALQVVARLARRSYPPALRLLPV
jgi:hypothetical protein